MKKHDSLDDPPPNYPYFKARKTLSNANCNQENTRVMETMSPTRRIQARSLCIEQLQKIGDLLSKGLISQDQHKELHDAIMKDML